MAWSSKKQTIIAQSTMEAEYVSLSEAAKEAIWLKNFLVELAIPEVEARVTLYCDNQAAILISKNPKKHGKAKHIDKRFHLVRDLVKKGEIYLEYIPTHLMLADSLTKPIPAGRLEEYLRCMGLKC